MGEWASTVLIPRTCCCLVRAWAAQRCRKGPCCWRYGNVRYQNTVKYAQSTNTSVGLPQHRHQGRSPPVVPPDAKGATTHQLWPRPRILSKKVYVFKLSAYAGLNCHDLVNKRGYALVASSPCAQLEYWISDNLSYIAKSMASALATSVLSPFGVGRSDH